VRGRVYDWEQSEHCDFEQPAAATSVVGIGEASPRVSTNSVTFWHRSLPVFHCFGGLMTASGQVALFGNGSMNGNDGSAAADQPFRIGPAILPTNAKTCAFLKLLVVARDRANPEPGNQLSRVRLGHLHR
jgi:hypothetical protein